MKKVLVALLAGLMIFSLSSCVSTGLEKSLLTAENVDTLDTKSFTLTSIALRTDFSLSEKQQAANIIKNLPIEKIKADLLETYGITLDTSLFSAKEIEEQTGMATSDKGSSLGIWMWQNKPEEKIPSGIMTVAIRAYNINDPLFLSVSTSLYDSTGASLAHVYGESNWVSAETIADKKTAAIVKFAKHISPDFVLTKNGIESFAAYKKNNSAGDDGVYVDTTYPVKISATVSDPGVFLVVDPCIVSDAVIDETYESGKTYTITYEVDRSTFSKYNWKIKYSKVEE